MVRLGWLGFGVLLLMVPTASIADGPSATQLQQQLAAAPNAGLHGLNPIGGDASATVVRVIGAGAGRTLAARASEHIIVGDFSYATATGKVGGDTAGVLGTMLPAGSTSLTLLGNLLTSKGELVLGQGVAPGTVTTDAGTFDPVRNVTTVPLSLPTVASSAAPTVYDLATQDDLPAFAAALAAGVKAIEVPAGRYYLSAYVGDQPGTQWLVEGASFAPGGGIAEAVNQSLAQSPVGPGLGIFRYFTSAYGGEQSLLLSAYSADVGSVMSDQKNIEHIQGAQAAQSKYLFLGDSVQAVHDLVGLSEQVSCSMTNLRCSLFGRNLIVTLPPTTDGPAVGEEMQIKNNRTQSATEIESWDNVSAVDYIVSGNSALSTGLTFQGNIVGGAPGFNNGILFKQGAVADSVLAVRQGASQGVNGISAGHTDLLRLDANGAALLQTLHVGGGQASNDVYPSAGLNVTSGGDMTAPSLSANTITSTGFSVTGDANGAIALGNSAAAVTPYIDFLSAGQSDCRLINNSSNNLTLQCGGQTDVVFCTAGTTYTGDLRAPTVVSTENSTRVATTAWTRGLLAYRTLSAQSSSYVLSAADCGTVIRDNGSASHQYTVPQLPVGCQIDVVQAGTGSISFLPGAGLNIESLGNATRTTGQFAKASLLIDTGSTVLLTGQIQ